jgi:hypothetical protein
MQSTGLSQQPKYDSMSTNTVNRIADAIFRAEGGVRTTHPYGVKLVTDHPRHVCINTINHAWRDFEGDTRNKERFAREAFDRPELPGIVSLPFIQFLGKRYCPPSVDGRGYRNWTNNVWRIGQFNVSKN